MREYGSPARAEIRPSASLADVVFRRAEADPARVMLRRRVARAWEDVTASQFCAEVKALAKGIIAAGVEPGDRVGLLSRTRYEWTLIDYAIWSAGCVTVPVYETSSAEQVEWMLGDSAARAVFAETSRHAELLGSVQGRLPRLQHKWQIGDLSAVVAGGADISDQQIRQRRLAAMAADLATIVYTSGTTGRPKGCQLSHGSLLADVRNAVAALPEIFDRPGSSTLLFLPLAHVFARIIQVGVLEAGAVLGHWPDPATLADGLAEFHPTFLLAVPRVFEKIYDSAQQQASGGTAGAAIFAAASRTAVAWSKAHAAGRRGGPALRLRHVLFDQAVYRRLRAAAGGRLEYAVSGGAPLSEWLGHFFRGAGVTVLEGYGLTESAGAATVNRPGRNKIGTAGRPLPGITVRIGGNGEILIQGRSVFTGYWHNEPATREALDVDGWLHTGDVGALDDEGFLLITGRRKDLIVTAGGTNVAPAILEDRIRAHPLVSQCMVVGEGRPFVACLITLDPQSLDSWTRRHGRRPGATASDVADDPDLVADIQHAVDAANKAVSRAESIRRFKILGTDFSEACGQLTPSDKIRRDVVAADYAADIAAIYA